MDTYTCKVWIQLGTSTFFYTVHLKRIFSDDRCGPCQLPGQDRGRAGRHHTLLFPCSSRLPSVCSECCSARLLKTRIQRERAYLGQPHAFLHKDPPFFLTAQLHPGGLNQSRGSSAEHSVATAIHRGGEACVLHGWPRTCCYQGAIPI